MFKNEIKDLERKLDRLMGLLEDKFGGSISDFPYQQEMAWYENLGAKPFILPKEFGEIIENLKSENQLLKDYLGVEIVLETKIIRKIKK